MKYIKVYTDFARAMECLTYEEKGRLFEAMLLYGDNGQEPAFDGALRIVWPMVRNDIDRAAESYEKKANTSRENGKKGGRPPKNPVGLYKT